LLTAGAFESGASIGLSSPNGYILGEEAGGALIGGLRYGDGTLYTKNAGDLRVFGRGRRSGLMQELTARTL
jgi:hypothetical protein